MDQGIEGLHDELRPGRPRTYEDDHVAEVIHRALQTRPADGSTHWSARSLAAATGISKTTVHRWLQTFLVQPHRQKTVMKRLERHLHYSCYFRDGTLGNYTNSRDAGGRGSTAHGAARQSLEEADQISD